MKPLLIKALPLFLLLLCACTGFSQMRQLYLDTPDSTNHIEKIHFYNGSEGYAAFSYNLGFTSDSGRTFQKKYITLNNVNYNSYSVNLTFGFSITGVHAFNHDTLLVYGHYGFVPAILYSTDQGTTFKLVYHSQFSFQQMTRGVMDMVFPQNDNVGYAVEFNRIIKTTDRGKTWFTSYSDPNAFYTKIIGIDNTHLFAMASEYPGNKLMRTTNGGTWTSIPFTGNIHHASFITANKGWIIVDDNLYYTSDAGATLRQMNKSEAAPSYSPFFKFVDDSTGYTIGGSFSVWKTTDSGKVWQSLPRDNNYNFLNYSHVDIYFHNKNQFWAGGNHGFLELTTNGGGKPYPHAQMIVDTTGYYVSQQVKLFNDSKPGLLCKWLVNGVQVGTAYNTVYTHNTITNGDTVLLIVSDGVNSDTAIRHLWFDPPPPPPVPYTGWQNKAANIADNLLDIRVQGNYGAVIGENGFYYTTTGVNNATGWIRLAISGSPGDSAIFARTKFKRMASNEVTPLFYAIGNDTVNNKAVMIRFDATSLTVKILYYGSAGTKVNGFTFAPYYNAFFGVGDNGLAMGYFINAPAAGPVPFNSTRKLVSIFDPSDASHPDHLTVVSDSVVYSVFYLGGPDGFIIDHSKKFSKEYTDGVVSPSGQFLVTSNENKLYSLGFGAVADYEDTFSRIKPAGLTYNSITRSGYPRVNFLATNKGIYRVFAGPPYVTIEYQPTSERKDINRIWFRLMHPWDTAYAVGRNGVILESFNFGGPPVPYAEIISTGSCFGESMPLQGVSGSASSCKWYLDGGLYSVSCTPSITIATPGPHTLKLIASNIHGLADTATKTIYVAAAPNVDLPISGYDSVLCRSERMYITLQATQAGYKYSLMDSSGVSYGAATSTTGGQLLLITDSIKRTGNYFIQVMNMQGGCSRNFTRKVFVRVENPKARMISNMINVLPGEKVNLFHIVPGAQSFQWQLPADASIQTASTPSVQDVSFTIPGPKSVRLIATTLDGCADTATTVALHVYNKPVPDDNAFLLGVDSSKLHGQLYRKIAETAKGDGFLLAGGNDGPLLTSRYGMSPQLPYNATNYVGKYTVDGALKWFNYLNSGLISGATDAPDGSVYVFGRATPYDYYHFSNGDSLRVARTPIDTVSYLYPLQGFVIKMDSTGKYLWHVVLADSLSIPDLLIKNAHVEQNGLLLSGSFRNRISYSNASERQSIYVSSFPNQSNPHANDFVLELGADGSFHWVIGFDNTSLNYNFGTTSMGTDGNGNIYVAGGYEFSMKLFDAAHAPTSYGGSVGSMHTYLFKFTPSGQLTWKVLLEQNTANGSVSPGELSVDAIGNSYLTTRTSLNDLTAQTISVTTPAGVKTVAKSPYCITKFNTAGTLLWSAGGQPTYTLLGNNVEHHITLRDRNLFLVTRISPSNSQSSAVHHFISADSSAVETFLTENSIQVFKIDTAGILQQYLSSGLLSQNRPELYRVVTDAKKNIYVAGHRGPASTQLFGQALSGGSIDDIFVLKIDSNLNQAPVWPVANAGPDRSTCSGNPTTLGVSASGDKYYWISSPAGFTSTLPNPVVSPNVSTTYFLTVINSSGFISRDTVIVSVSGPTANAGLDRTVCAGAQAVIGSPSVPGYQYSWSSSNGLFSSALAQPTVSPAANTSYYLTLTVGNSTCVAMDTVVLTVTPLPPANAGPDKTICAGGLQAAAIGSPAIPGFSYSWTPTSGITTPTFASLSAMPNVTTEYIITVSNTTTGCIRKDSVIVTVQQSLALPVISPGGPLILCSGSQLLVSSSSSGNQWYKNGLAITGATGQSYTATQVGNYQVQYTSGQCKSDVSSGVVISAVPTISYSGPTSFCGGGSITLNSSASANVQWNLNGVPITGATSASYVASTTGSYTVTVTGGNCNGTSTPVVVTITSPPSAPTITASGPLTACQGSNLTLTSSASTGNQWFRDGTAITGATGTTLAVTQTGNYSVQSTSGACTSPMSALSSVTIVTGPSAPVVSAAGPLTFCQGGSVLLTSATAVNPQWYLNNAPISGANANSFTATQPGNYTVVSNNSGCSATSTAISVAVTQLPSTPVISVGGSLTVCSGNSVLLTSSATVGNQWYRNNVAITGANGIVYSANQAGTYTVSTTPGACASAQSSGVTVVVSNVVATPIISASGPVSICTGGSVVLTSSAASGNQWMLNGTSITGAVGTTLTVTTAGDYSVVSSQGACTSPSSTNTTVVVSPYPSTPTITAANLVLSSSAASGNQWYLNGVLISGATGQDYMPTVSGVYTVTVTTNGCSSSSQPMNFAVTSVVDLSLRSEFRLLPNPVSTMLHVEYKGNPRNFYLSVMDATGRRITARMLFNKSIDIDMSRFAAGFYFVEIHDVRQGSVIQLPVVKK